MQSLAMRQHRQQAALLALLRVNLQTQPALLNPLQPQPLLRQHLRLLHRQLLAFNLQYPRKFMANLRKWLFAGLLVIVPFAITIWLLEWMLSTLDKTLLILPAAWHPDKLIGFHIPGFGLLLALAILLLVGAAASNFLGRQLMIWGHVILNRIPVVRSIYSSVKQVSDTLFADGGSAFRTAVLVQWPRADVWTIAFVTGTPGGDVTNHLKGDYLSVYVPTTPNPTGGYFVMLKKSDCIELNMSVDDALKYIVSMGVVSPTMLAPLIQK
jgi:uncharacterized membrane protein